MVLSSLLGCVSKHQVLWKGIGSRYKQTTGAVRSVRLHVIRLVCYECAHFLNIPTVLSQGHIYVISPRKHISVCECTVLNLERIPY